MTCDDPIRPESVPLMSNAPKPFKVASCAATFGVFTRDAVTRLESAGCEVKINPHGRVLTKAEIVDFAYDADAVIVGNDDFSAAVIDGLPNLRLIARHGSGVNNIDYSAAVKRGIVVTNTPGVNAEETADLTFGLILDLERHITLMNNELKGDAWKKRAGHSLHDKTIGIIGVGAIGRAVARRAMGFGMDILGNDIHPSEEATRLGLIYTSLNDLLRRSDIVTIHTPLTSATKNLIGAKELRMMKPEAILVNTARDGIIRHSALEKTLLSGQLYGYAADVHDGEPPKRSPIFDLPNVLVTPHAGSATYESNLRMGMAVADNIIAFKDGVTPPHVVSPMSRIYG